MKEWIVGDAEQLNGRVLLMIKLAVGKLEELSLIRRQLGRFGRQPDMALLDSHRLLLRAPDLSFFRTEPDQPCLDTLLVDDLDETDTARLVLDDDELGIPFLLRRSSGPLFMPVNALTKNAYNGINVVSLWVAAEVKNYAAPI